MPQTREIFNKFNEERKIEKSEVSIVHGNTSITRSCDAWEIKIFREATRSATDQGKILTSIKHPSIEKEKL